MSKILSSFKNIVIDCILIYAVFALFIGFDKANELVMNIINMFI